MVSLRNAYRASSGQPASIANAIPPSLNHGSVLISVPAAGVKEQASKRCIRSVAIVARKALGDAAGRIQTMDHSGLPDSTSTGGLSWTCVQANHSRLTEIKPSLRPAACPGLVSAFNRSAGAAGVEAPWARTPQSAKPCREGKAAAHAGHSASTRAAPPSGSPSGKAAVRPARGHSQDREKVAQAPRLPRSTRWQSTPGLSRRYCVA